MLHIKYLSNSHQEKGDNCFCQCTISRTLWVETVENGSILINYKMTDSKKCPKMH